MKPRSSPAILLVEPLDPINIGSVIRVCRNFGFRDLRLVAPRVWDVDRMTITAPHSGPWIEAHARVFDTFEDALDGLDHLYGFTARSRERRTRFARLGDAIDEIAGHADAARSAFVFGREDTGLPNAITERCTACIQIETSDEYPSINLAQAVLLAAWRWFSVEGDARPLPVATRTFPDAPAAGVERLLGMLADHLEAIRFYRGTQRDNIDATLRRVITRAELDTQELATLLGIVAETRKALAASPQNGSE